MADGQNVPSEDVDPNAVLRNLEELLSRAQECLNTRSYNPYEAKALLLNSLQVLQHHKDLRKQQPNASLFRIKPKLHQYLGLTYIHLTKYKEESRAQNIQSAFDEFSNALCCDNLTPEIICDVTNPLQILVKDKCLSWLDVDTTNSYAKVIKLLRKWAKSNYIFVELLLHYLIATSKLTHVRENEKSECLLFQARLSKVQGNSQKAIQLCDKAKALAKSEPVERELARVAINACFKEGELFTALSYLQKFKEDDKFAVLSGECKAKVKEKVKDLIGKNQISSAESYLKHYEEDGEFAPLHEKLRKKRQEWDDLLQERKEEVDVDWLPPEMLNSKKNQNQWKTISKKTKKNTKPVTNHVREADNITMKDEACSQPVKQHLQYTTIDSDKTQADLIKTCENHSSDFLQIHTHDKERTEWSNFCIPCKKKFNAKQQYEEHIQSQKHQRNDAFFTSKDTAGKATLTQNNKLQPQIEPTVIPGPHDVKEGNILKTNDTISDTKASSSRPEELSEERLNGSKDTMLLDQKDMLQTPTIINQEERKMNDAKVDKKVVETNAINSNVIMPSGEEEEVELEGPFKQQNGETETSCGDIVTKIEMERNSGLSFVFDDDKSDGLSRCSSRASVLQEDPAIMQIKDTVPATMSLQQPTAIKELQRKPVSNEVVQDNSSIHPEAQTQDRVSTTTAWHKPIAIKNIQMKHVSNKRIPVNQSSRKRHIPNHCDICHKICNSEVQFGYHKGSKKHQRKMIKKRNERKWNFRTLPKDCTFELCDKHDKGNKCEYSFVEMKFNKCDKAHGQDELDEWHEQDDHNKMFDRKYHNLMSYIQDMQNGKSDQTISLQNKVEGVQYMINNNTVKTDGIQHIVPKQEKVTTEQWELTIETDRPIEKICLIQDSQRSNFEMEVPEEYTGEGYEEKQFALITYPTDQNEDFDLSFSLKFKSHCFGKFEQDIVLDFGERTKLIIPIKLEIVSADTKSAEINKKLSELIESVEEQAQWKYLIPFGEERNSTLKELVEDITFQDPKQTEEKLSADTYEPITVNLIHMEWKAYKTAIKRYNISSVARMKTYKNGLIAKVPLTSDIMKGQHLLETVEYVAISKKNETQLYEACILKDVSGEQINGRSSLCIVLSNRCCEDWILKEGDDVDLTIQFIPDELRFKLMKYAVRQISSSNQKSRLIYPCTNDIPRDLEKESIQDREKLTGLTEQQKDVAMCILKQNAAPPVVIYGAFGTGKTQTLAHSAVITAIANKKKGNKKAVLICTNDKSSSDLFATLFDGFKENGLYNSMKGVKYTRNSVSDKIKCSNHDIIITTLRDSLGMHAKETKRPYFSHILIDEATSSLEPETIMPLTFADEKTVVVLAGDHLQVTPTVVSETAKEENFQLTLLQRLYSHYKARDETNLSEYSHCMNKNFRSHPQILEFLSDCFYGGKLESGMTEKAMMETWNLNVKPMTFVDTRGDVKNSEMWSCFNMAEVDTICQEIKNLVDEKSIHLDKIAIITSSYAQVMKFRERLEYIDSAFKDIFVDLPQNSRSREYQHIFVSTIDSLSNTAISPLRKDRKLLNTTFGRAEQSIYVCGDAEALQSASPCQTIWTTFIERCSEKSDSEDDRISTVSDAPSRDDENEWLQVDDIVEDLKKDKERENIVTGNLKNQSVVDIAETVVSCDTVYDREDDYKEKRNLRSGYDAEIDNSTRCDEREYDFPQYYPEEVELMMKATERGSSFEECYISIEGGVFARCTPINPYKAKYTIEIYGRRNCGQTQTGDKVLVEILNRKKDDLIINDAIPRRGRVIKILKQCRNLIGSRFVCTIQKQSSYDRAVHMKPLSKCLPGINIYEPKEQKGFIDKKIHVCKIESRRLKHLKKIKHDPNKNKLYVVQILNWNNHFPYPLGTVVEIKNGGDALVRGTNILKMEYISPPSHEESGITSYKERSYSKQRKRKRKDGLRRIFTFTIDPADANERDDAISMEDLDDGGYRIGIHISDVSDVIPIGSRIDNAAKEKGFTHYAYGHDQVVEMLPQYITEGCSLEEGEDRDVVSLLFEVDQNFCLKEKSCEFKCSTIRVDKKFSYDEVEQILDGEADSEHQTELRDLHQITVKMSIVRTKGVSYMDYISIDNKKACKMIEELMTYMNNRAGNELLLKYPESVPLRHQFTADEEDKEKWIEENRGTVQYLASLKHCIECEWNDVQYLSIKSLHVTGIRNGTLKAERVFSSEESIPQLLASKVNWYKLQAFANYISSGCLEKDERGHSSLNYECYVQMTSPIRRYLDIVSQRMLKAAIDGSDSPYSVEQMEELCEDINLKKTQEKEFHRRSEALLRGTFLKHNPVQILATVTAVTDKCIELGSHGDWLKLPKSRTVQFSHLSLQSAPIADGNNFPLQWAKRVFDKTTDEFKKDWSINTNKYESQEFQLEDTRFVKKYNAYQSYIPRESHFMKVLENMDNRGTADDRRPRKPIVKPDVLTTEGYDSRFQLRVKKGSVLKVQLGSTIHQGMAIPNIELINLTETYNLCIQHNKDPISCFSRIAVESTKEEYNNIEEYQNVYKPLLSMESVTSTINEGESDTIKNCAVQWVTPNTGRIEFRKDFCLKRNIFLNSQDLTKEPLEEMDATQFYICLVSPLLNQDELITNELKSLNEVDTVLDQTYKDVKKERDFVNKVVKQKKPKHWIGHGVVTGVEKLEEISDMVKFRIQSSNFSLPDELRENEESDEEVVEDDEDDVIDINSPVFKVKKFKPPHHPYTVEILPVGFSMRKMECALGNLGKSTPLIKKIVLRTDINSRIKVESYEEIEDLPAKYMQGHKINDPQKEAIEAALEQDFSLIQGPPGTGKTETAVRLIHAFGARNRARTTEKISKKMLYCGPSNKSVDVIAGLLKKSLMPRGSKSICPRILRVYSSTIVTKDYPVPGVPQRGTKGSEDSKADPNHKDVTLHHILHGEKRRNPFTERIVEAYAMIRSDKWVGNYNDIKRYQLLLKCGELFELHTCEVILCTCAHSAKVLQKLSMTLMDLELLILADNKNPKGVECAKTQDKTEQSGETKKTSCIKPVSEEEKNKLAEVMCDTKIGQLIIDEAAMCTEPEALIAMVATKAPQIVLIGDHKQLRPIVTNRIAENLGFDSTFFQRYEESAKMLQIQYRMHPSICQFPSNQFYDGLLQADVSQSEEALTSRDILKGYWQGGDDQRTVFLNVCGEEKILTVGTSEGNVSSTSNEQEMDHAVRIYRCLLHKLYKNEDAFKNIAVLSQYRAQCALIHKEIDKYLELRHEATSVNTVVKSQGGEWEYVILSTVRSMQSEAIPEDITQKWKSKHLGFIIDENQINVALTRARFGLIIIGNADLLSCDPMWKELIEDYKDRDCFIEATDFLTDLSKGLPGMPEDWDQKYDAYDINEEQRAPRLSREASKDCLRKIKADTMLIECEWLLREALSGVLRMRDLPETENRRWNERFESFFARTSYDGTKRPRWTETKDYLKQVGPILHNGHELLAEFGRKSSFKDRFVVPLKRLRNMWSQWNHIQDPNLSISELKILLKQMEILDMPRMTHKKVYLKKMKEEHLKCLEKLEEIHHKMVEYNENHRDMYKETGADYFKTRLRNYGIIRGMPNSSRLRSFRTPAEHDDLHPLNNDEVDDADAESIIQIEEISDDETVSEGESTQADEPYINSETKTMHGQSQSRHTSGTLRNVDSGDARQSIVSLNVSADLVPPSLCAEILYMVDDDGSTNTGSNIAIDRDKTLRKSKDPNMVDDINASVDQLSHSQSEPNGDANEENLIEQEAGEAGSKQASSKKKKSKRKRKKH
ncbi:unnamed protein product [Owenia fusiformis]|uniref:Uncharacterized protein n=1 Tax=Owenia fusiformis TaxID=6347 RepID=A0A8J1Y1H7_OWEFU|nr:unnamed protein product [Owenia fusiformis]